MDTNTILLVVLLLFSAIILLIFSQKKPPSPPTPLATGEGTIEKYHLEFSKLIMGIVLLMWVIGGLVGFWVVVFRDISQLMDILDYIQTPVVTSVGIYGAKSGVENWAKLSQNKDKTSVTTTRNEEEENYE